MQLFLHSAYSLAGDKSSVGSISNRNRKSNTLVTIERNRNRDISKAKCDFDHTLFRCCSISVVRSQAISFVHTLQ